MSDLVRCDKCKEELPKKINKKKFFGLMTSSYTEKYTSFVYEGTFQREIKKQYHLCKSCSDAFEAWLNE